MTGPTPNSMPSRPAFAPRRPNPATVALAPGPHGWRDDVVLPAGDQPHLFVDTGVWFSIGSSMAAAGTGVAAMVAGHEGCPTIAREVVRAPGLTGLIGQTARPACQRQVEPAQVRVVQDELVADSQLRSGSTVSQSTRDNHGGEAELIVRSRAHAPMATIATNDIGASAVARSHGVNSVHFVHLVRAAVRASRVASVDAVAVAKAGLTTSKLNKVERDRVLTPAWLQS